MGSKFLQSGTDIELTNGTALLNIKSEVVQDLLPNLPVRTTTGKSLTSGLIQISDCAFSPIVEPYAGTLHVRDLVTAYNTTPVDLNTFIATTVNEITTAQTDISNLQSDVSTLQSDVSTLQSDVSTLQSNTQYISSSLGLTTISSNLATNDVYANNYKNSDGSIFIDMSNPGDISVNSTTFDFNADPVVVSTTSPSVDSNIAIYDSTSGYKIKDSGVNISAIGGGPFLPLSGGTMSGNINMGTSNINNISQILPVNTNINIGNSTSLAVGGIGNIVLGDFTTATANDCVCIGLQNFASGNSVAIGKETVSGTSSTVVGYRSTSFGQTDSIVIGHDNVSSATSGDILGVNLTNSTSNSLKIGNTSYVNIRSANTTTDLGTTLVPFQNIYSNASLVGPTNTRTVDNIVSNSGSSTSGDLCSFSGTTGKIITDSSIVAANVVTNSGSSTSGDLCSFSGVTGKIITDSSIIAANVITDSGNLVNNNLVKSSGLKTVSDSGIVASNVFLADGTVSATGTFNMNTHSISNVLSQTFTGSTLTGTNKIITIDNTFAKGNYINFGTFGRNIGIASGGPLFIVFNADYNSTSSTFINTFTQGCEYILMDGTLGHLQYSPSATIGSTVTPTDALTWDLSGNINLPNGNLSISTLGKTLKIKQGSNACFGTGAVLVAGTVTVSTTAIATGDTVFLSCTAAGGTQGIACISAISNGVSFTITSSQGLDTSTYSWLIIKGA